MANETTPMNATLVENNLFQPAAASSVRRWQRALCLALSLLIASGPVAARGGGRAGVDALMDDIDALAPAGANLPANMRSATEQMILLRDDATASGSQFGMSGDIPITVSPDAVGGGPAGMVLGAPQYSLSGELVVPLLNVVPNATVNGRPAVPAVLGNVGRIDLIPKLPALKSVEIPSVAGIGSFIRDKKMAIALGKALFWDANVGSDGNACASCHYAAGADNRLKNQLSPGLNAGDHVFSRHLPQVFKALTDRMKREGRKEAGHQFRGTASGGGGPNYTLKASDFPFTRLADPLDRNSALLFESNDVVSSQGTFSGDFVSLMSGGDEKCGDRTIDEFSVHGALTRRVAPRNSPTVINAVYNFRNFWDGRANNVFNGNNPFGDRDPNARVLEMKADGSVVPVRISLPNASLASQAVGPALSEFEMSCAGKTFKDLGRKMLRLRALQAQQVHAADSVLASFIARGGKGGKGLTLTYADMIKQAFHPDWWAGSGKFDGYTQMESNFSLFWGLAIMVYEATLISDETPVDHFVGWAGTAPNLSALGPAEQRGLVVFRGKALCVSCHKGAEFTSAATLLQPHRETNLTEQMFVGAGAIGLYDNGFYNIGVRPTSEDLGVGGMDPFGNPLSFSRQYLDGVRGKKAPDAFIVRPCLFAIMSDAKECWTAPDPDRTRTGVDGSFKTPGLRNIALTQPYFHNGSRFTLEQVVEFYNRGGDRRGPDGNDTSGYGSPNAPGGGSSNSHPSIRPLGLTRQERADLVAFLRNGLTDRRVACQAAPFDHPELKLPNGHAGDDRKVRMVNGRAVDEFITLPAVGSGGMQPAQCLRNDNGTQVKTLSIVSSGAKATGAK
jgi:cytochrome c peroxidase